MSVAVVSSLYGDAQDRFGTQPEQSVHADWIMVTDQVTPPDPGPWRFIHEPRPELGPRMAAKLAKFRPDLYTSADTIVWVDAACRFTDANGLERLIEWAGDALIAQWPHPYRQCLYAEAEASGGVWKYAHQNLTGQVLSYKAAGMPADWGLWATGVIVRNSPLPEFGALWLNEQFRWSDQDQVSEPYALWRSDLRPADLPHDIYTNPALGWDYAGRRW
jgi:hypothetical protein